MNYKWIIEKKSSGVILFFNGWGMDENPFRFLKSKGSDVVTLFDYREILFPQSLLRRFTEYEEISVIAWSMGVWACEYCRESLHRVERFTAINGTGKPVDRECGIMPELYDKTLETMDERGREAFFRRMFRRKEDFERFLKNSPRRNIEDQKEELARLKERTLEAPQKGLIWDRVLVGKKDRIIPFSSQEKFWKGKESEILEQGHFPFYSFKNWEDML